MSNTEHVQTGFAERNGTTLYYEVAGTGHPFVLLHGHLLDRRSWDDQFAVFAQAYRVIRYDQRGFGDSDGSLRRRRSPQQSSWSSRCVCVRPTNRQDRRTPGPLGGCPTRPPTS